MKAGCILYRARAFVNKF